VTGAGVAGGVAGAGGGVATSENDLSKLSKEEASGCWSGMGYFGLMVWSVTEWMSRL
jgi:hypothetical protein